MKTKNEQQTIPASPRINNYFAQLQKRTQAAFALAEKARKKHYDPVDHVEIVLAKNLAERVVGIISAVAPQIKNSGVVQRILELEKHYGALDWRVALIIAHEVAQEKFCTFKDKREAMEVGIRVGFAYVTVGVVSAPIEGFVTLELKDRRDKQGKYFCLVFAGPVRGAGGTAASVAVLIADYVRKKMGYATYDPDEKEVARTYAELEDYHEWVTNLQYFPSKEEADFMTKHLPLEISGDPSEKYEISNVNLKDLPRVPTNNLRSGFCLIHSSCLELKAPKLWGKIRKWAKEMDLEHWSFLEEFIAIQKKAKAKNTQATTQETSRITPDYTYIKDVVAGRPVFSHPLRPGGFRLRYGRGRASGFSAQSIHPATMIVTNNFIATGTQLKVERPGKAAAITPCDTIEGPIVLLRNGSVKKITTEDQARKLQPHIKNILFLGDILINYGDFFDRAHTLAPAGYTPEEWALELQNYLTTHHETITSLAEKTNINNDKLRSLFESPLTTTLTSHEAWTLATTTNTPLHPDHLYYWSLLTNDELLALRAWLQNKLTPQRTLPDSQEKHLLEKAGIPHDVNDGTIAFDNETHHNLLATLAINTKKNLPTRKDALSTLTAWSSVTIKDKAGTFIGARMGRPEKAKMRKMTGQPHGLFPVGNQGGRLRSIQSALTAGYISSQFADFYCHDCQAQTLFRRCHLCDGTNVEERSKAPIEAGERVPLKRSIPIKDVFSSTLNKLKTKIYPDLIKGVRGTTNKRHIPEHLAKAILRAKHNIAVNKDGTTRYDCSEIAITHFKPEEIGTPLQTLKELGYTHDIHHQPLTSPTQTLELLPQDIIIPCCPHSPEEGADEILFRTSKFIDDELRYLYHLKPYYNLTSKKDLVGELILGLAPHTSAAILGRIIGFSKTQTFLAHPFFHAAMRRDADGDESCIFLLMDGFLNFSKLYLPESRGSSMDAPLVLTYLLNPSEVDDMVFNLDRAWRYPLELYQAARAFKKPWDVKIELIADTLNTPAQFEGIGFTHDTTNINAGVLCSAYKTLPSMQEKLDGQMNLARKIRAVDEADVARLVIEKHFIRDIRGNLRKFSQQEIRCVDCNEKFRRPPLKGACTVCGGKLVFTISEGSIIKYLEPALKLARDYDVPAYLKENMDIVRRMVEENFGKDAEKQEGLGTFFS